ncbi:hypothetical protein B7486_00715 [cyanobacterium TDX16]|nr:hypothetical protein B7486_00715 [cyanobacterium TDX16]
MAAKKIMVMTLGVGVIFAAGTWVERAAGGASTEVIALASDNGAGQPPAHRAGPDDRPLGPPDGADRGGRGDGRRGEGQRGEGRRFGRGGGGKGEGARGSFGLESKIMDVVLEVVGDIGPEREAQLRNRLRDVLKDAARRHQRRDDGEGRGFGRGGRRGSVPGAGPLDGRRGDIGVFSDAPPPPPPPPSDPNWDADARPNDERDRAERPRGERRNEDRAREPRDGGRRFERFFARFDEDGNGSVSRDEFPGRPERFDRLDLNRDGEIERDELAEAMQPGEPRK